LTRLTILSDTFLSSVVRDIDSLMDSRLILTNEGLGQDAKDRTHAIMCRFSLEGKAESVWQTPLLLVLSLITFAFPGAGLWMPEAQPLASLRADIDRKPHRLKRVLMNPQLRKQILRGAPNDEKKVIKAFATQNSENALKTKPKVRLHLPEHLPRVRRGACGMGGSMGSVHSWACNKPCAACRYVCRVM
jgi:hypothetical protein